MSWRSLAADDPQLAAAGEELLRAFTLAYLATVRADGGPRVHPVTVTLYDAELWLFAVAGTPKASELLRDGRVALHNFPRLPQGTLDSYVDDELVLFGRAESVTDPSVRAAIEGAHNDSVSPADLLFRIELERAQHKTRREGRAVYRRWSASSSRSRSDSSFQ